MRVVLLNYCAANPTNFYNHVEDLLHHRKDLDKFTKNKKSSEKSNSYDSLAVL